MGQLGPSRYLIHTNKHMCAHTLSVGEAERLGLLFMNFVNKRIRIKSDSQIYRDIKIHEAWGLSESKQNALSSVLWELKNMNW